MYEITFAYWSEALQTYTVEKAVVLANTKPDAIAILLDDMPKMK